MSPLEAIRKRCLDCRGFHPSEVRDCDPTFEQGQECPLYPYRFGSRPKEKPELTTLQAIRAFCLHCCNDSSYEVTMCPAEDCPAWGFRDGHNPNRKGMGKSAEQMAEVRANSNGFYGENKPVSKGFIDSEYEDEEFFNEND